MAKHSYDVTIDGQDYVVDSDTPLSDMDAYTYAKQQHTVSNFDVKKQNEIMRANMAKQTGATESPTDAFIKGASENMIATGVQQAHEGVKQMAEGYSKTAEERGPNASPHPILAGSHKIVTGLGQASLPAAAPFILANPVTSAAVIGTGYVAGKTLRKGGEMAGAGEDVQNSLEDAGNIIGGKGGADIVDPALRAAGTFAAEKVAASPKVALRIAEHTPIIGKYIKGARIINDLTGGSAKAAKVPPTVEEQLGVTKDSLGATMPETHQPPKAQVILQKQSSRGAVPVVDRTGPEALLKEQPLFKQQAALETYGAPAEAPMTGRAQTPPTPNPELALKEQPTYMQQDALQRHGTIAEPPADAGRASTPTHEQVGGRGTRREGEVPAGAVENTPTIDSERTMPDAYREELLKALEQKRAERNAAFDANIAEHGAAPLSQGASPQEVANAYAKSKGLPEPKPHTPVKVDPERAKLIADAYEKMQHNPSDLRTKQAYDALARETADQFYFIKAHTGLKTEPWTGSGQPYADSKAMMADVKDNNHMWYFPTEAGYGEAGAVSDHPLLKTLPTAPNGQEGEMPFNDMFRIVHDYFAHAKGGHQFGPHGEENAFLEHAKMYSPDALAALASETRGQNSWVNFGPHMRNAEGALLKQGEPGFLDVTKRPYAAQKAGLLPPELRGLNPENARAAVHPNELKANAALGTKEDQALVAEAGKTPVDKPSAIVQMKQETTPEAVARKSKELQEFLAKQMENPEAGKAEVVTESGTKTNGSGERGQVSAEEIARVKAVTDKGGEFIHRRKNPGGKPIDVKVSDPKKVADPEGWLKAGDQLIEVDAHGNETVRAHGSKGGPMTAEEKFLIGNRGAGHSTQAQRLAMLRELQARGK